MGRVAMRLFYLGVVLVVLACLGVILPLELVYYLLAGWYLYLARVLPEVQISWSMIGLGLLCMTVLGVGLDLFMSWVTREIAPGRVWKHRWTGSIVASVVVLFVAGMAVTGIVHQVGWLATSSRIIVASMGSRAIANRYQSVNNMKQIGFAVANYESRYGKLPPGALFDENGQPLHGWPALLLGDMGQAAEFANRIDFSRPWDDPVNAPVFRQVVSSLLNPGVREQFKPGDFVPNHYATNAYVIGGDRSLTIPQITDGTSQTFFGGEAKGNYKPWGHPVQWRDPALGINQSADGFGGPFVGGSNFMFGDGSARFIKNTISPKVFKALSTPDGGEMINQDSY